MKNLLALLFCCIMINAHAQIISPDTICTGTTVNFTTLQPAVTYNWEFNTLNVIQPPSPLTPLSSASGFATPSWSCFMKDGANYYCFVTEYNTGNVKRLSYGTSIYGVPVVTNLGTFGGTAGNTEGIDIAKDSATGLWYGLVVNYGQLIVLSFGASLSNTPTSTVTSYPQILWTHQVTIKRYGGNWIAFLANRNGSILRFEFGSALTNPPVITTLPILAGVFTPCNFSLYEQAGQWYMLITNLVVNTATRYSFGTNLLNNSPTGTVLASPPGMLSLPRGVFILPDCSGHLVAYIINETGNIIRMDFAGDITNAPTFTNMGPSGTTNTGCGNPCAFNDTLYYLLPNYATGVVYKYMPLDFNPPESLSYFIPTMPYTFSTPGTYSVGLYMDMARPSGPSVACKSITVETIGPITGIPVICVGGTTTLSNSIPGGTWSSSAPGIASVGSSTGVVTGISVGTATITYTTGPGCTAYFTVTVVPGSSISGPTTVCTGNSIILTAGGTGTWSSSSPGIASVNTLGIVTGITPGTATIIFTPTGGCAAGMVVTVAPTPVITGPSTVCLGDNITLSSSVTGGIWTSSNTSVATVNSSSGVVSGASGGTTTISYITSAGCSASLIVTVITAAPISGPSSLCIGGTITLSNAISGGTWSSSTPAVASITSLGVVTGLSAGTSIISYASGACSATLTITVNPLPPAITGIMQICVATATTLSDAAPGGTWASGNPGVAIVGLTTGIVTGISAGTAPITYTLPTGCLVTTNVTINSLPPAITGPANICLGATTTLYNLFIGGTWSSSNSSIATIGSSSGDVNGISAGVAAVTYTDANGCMITTSITINPPPPAPITTNLDYCQNATAVAALTAVGANLAWYPTSSGVVPITPTPTPSTSAAGIFTWYVSQTVNGCEGPRSPITVTIHPQSPFTIEASKPHICQFDSVNFAYVGPMFPGILFKWEIPGYGAIVSGTDLSDSLSIRFDTAYHHNIITLTVGDGYKPCDVIDSMDVKVDNTLPEAYFYIKPHVCIGDTVTVALTYHVDGVTDYTWDFNGGNVIIANSNHGGPYGVVWNTKGQHIVSVTSITNVACPPHDAKDTFEVDDPDSRIAPIYQDVCMGDSLLLSPVTYSSENKYTWAPDHFFKQNNSNSIYGRIERAGFVTLTVDDPFGCTSTSSVYLDAKSCCDVFLPNAFTPGIEGSKNALFRPVTNGNHTVHIFRVMNRWGQTVYQSAEEKCGWDGYYNGVPQDVDVYFYYFKYDCNGKTIEKKGDVTLIR